MSQVWIRVVNLSIQASWLVLAVILEHFMGIYGVYLACGIAVSSSVPVGWWFYRSNRWKIAKNVA